jgi:hypothetical protein
VEAGCECGGLVGRAEVFDVEGAGDGGGGGGREG